MKERLRPYVLPAAIVLGLLLHKWCAYFSFLVPVIIFCILLLTFTAVDLRRLRLSMLDLWLILFQLVVSTGSYAAVTLLGGSHIVAEGVLIGVLCPVASAVAVVATMLGANRETVTTYTIVGNLMVAVAAPFIFTLVGDHPEMSFTDSLLLMFGKIGSTLALPFFLAVLLQFMLPTANAFIARYKGAGFYLWALALLFTLGQTIDYIFRHGEGNWGSIAWLGALALAYCALQFGFGRWLGRRHGDVVSGGQLLGQKNSAIGIWMANTFLTPLSSVFLAFYSIYQNLFNAWQLARTKRRNP
ncbi:MAG: transporter [Bacteroidales bacterium]|nr:transporter [Bacteroidales bacterium]